MKRRICILLAILAALSLTACQATPEEVIVVQKDTERLIEQVQNDDSGTKASDIELPQENYVFSQTSDDGKITINVDATVETPAKGKVPTARVSMGSFTQEQIYGFFNYLFPDEKPYLQVNPNDLPDTKDELQEQILIYKKYVAEGTVEENTLYTEEEMLEEIARLEEEIKTAPETVNTNAQGKIISDGTLMKGSVSVYEGSQDVLELDVLTDSEKHLSVTIPTDPHKEWTGSFVYSGSIDEDLSSPALERIPNIDDSSLEGYSNAKSRMDGFFAAGGIDDVALKTAYRVNNEAFYKLIYVRTIGDIACADIPRGTGRGDENALPWNYEGITAFVKPDQIAHISWDDYTEPGEIISEDTGLMSFEEIQSVFESMISVTYALDENDSKKEITIDEIELSVVRVREQNAAGRNGVYTPAWVFYGSELSIDGFERYNSGSSIPSERYPIMVINAVDGTIIDLSKGY